MSKRAKSKQTHKRVPGFSFIRACNNIFEYRLKRNGLTVLYKHIPDTNVVTTNITYRVGARDERIGETGLAHMLEHMLFKPTAHDIKRKSESGAMRFERETGCILNANTWRDRTTYFFSYPVSYLGQALQIEAERMNDVVLNDKEFQPERSNVLSEFDMYFGDPEFALTTTMSGSAFHSHPYGHETIGFREDIERYTVDTLERFYRMYYRPDNATLMVIGDIPVTEALSAVAEKFGSIKNPEISISRPNIAEPKQEGIRRTTISRESNTNLLAIGVKHAGFPAQNWFETMVLLDVLAGRSDSELHKLLVDSGKASSVAYMIEPTQDQNLAIIYITLAKGVSHSDVEEETLQAIRSLTKKVIDRSVKKSVQTIRTNEMFAYDSSLRIAMELTEHVAAGDWSTIAEVDTMISKVTTSNIVARASELFTDQNLTIGHFIGTKK